MSVPKSVVRINKKGVQYISEVDKCSYYIHELTRAAMRDVGKFLARTFRDSYYSHFTKRTGDAGKATKYRVRSGKTTIYPRLEIGLKKGQVAGFYGYFQEFGTRKTPRLGLLQKAAKENIDEIIRIESQYLSALNGSESSCNGKIDESDYEGSADE